MHKIWVTVPVENQLQQLCDPSNQLIPNVDEISTEFCPGNISLLQEVCQLYFFFLFEGLATKPCTWCKTEERGKGRQPPKPSFKPDDDDDDDVCGVKSSCPEALTSLPSFGGC